MNATGSIMHGSNRKTYPLTAREFGHPLLLLLITLVWFTGEHPDLIPALSSCLRYNPPV